ncbi:MAG: DUF3892 domain-containing protein [Candidatus Margulisiibacteriota bacterium]
MKIILVITNSKGKKVGFIADNGQLLTLQEAIAATEKGLFEHVRILKTKTGIFLRSNLNSLLEDNLNNMVVKYGIFFRNIKNEILENYLKNRSDNLEKKYSHGDLIYIDGIARTYKPDVISVISKNSDNIKMSARKYGIDPFILGSILIDEYCRRNIDDRADFLAIFGTNTSVGLAQVKIATARSMISQNICKDEAFTASLSNKELYDYLVQEKYSIDFAAARIRQIIDYWKKQKNVNINTRADVIGQVYSQGLGRPKENPIILDRGNQVKNEFYPLAQQIIKQS